MYKRQGLRHDVPLVLGDRDWSTSRLPQPPPVRNCRVHGGGDRPLPTPKPLTFLVLIVGMPAATDVCLQARPPRRRHIPTIFSCKCSRQTNHPFLTAVQQRSGLLSSIQADRHADRKADMQTDRHADKQTDRSAGRQTFRRTYEQTCTQTKRIDRHNHTDRPRKTDRQKDRAIIPIRAYYLYLPWPLFAGHQVPTFRRRTIIA